MGSADSVENFIRSYGDLIFDLCEFTLSMPLNTQLAFRSILKTLYKASSSQKYIQYERSWVLRIVCEQIKKLHSKQNSPTSPEEQMKLDATETIALRLKQLNAYFRRLPIQDQLLLLLKDKHHIPYSEISVALAIPEGSLKIRKQQALRSLEEWLWNNS